jgi:hypothetical protein
LDTDKLEVKKRLFEDIYDGIGIVGTVENNNRLFISINDQIYLFKINDPKVEESLELITIFQGDSLFLDKFMIWKNYFSYFDGANKIGNVMKFSDKQFNGEVVSKKCIEGQFVLHVDPIKGYLFTSDGPF